MPSYLIESYLPQSPKAVEEEQARARHAATLCTGVRYVRTTFVPEDETVLHVFEAASSATVRDAAGQAQLRFERIVEVFEGAPGGVDSAGTCEGRT